MTAEPSVSRHRKSGSKGASGEGSFIRAWSIRPILTSIRVDLNILENVMFHHFGKNLVHVDRYELLRLTDYVSFFEDLARRTDMKALGVEVAQAQDISEFMGWIALIFHHAPTLRVALLKLSKFSHSWQTATQMAVREDADDAIFEYKILDQTIWPRGQDAEFSLALTLQLMRKMLGQGWRPREVHFEHAAISKMPLYIDKFSKRVLFNQTSNRIIFNLRDLDRPIRETNDEFLFIIERHAEDMKIGNGNVNLIEQISWYIERHLSDNQISLAQIAHFFALSPRSLQRHLADSGTSLRELLLKKRIVATARMLLDDSLSLSEIAYAVGYSDTTTFRRAFQARIGKSPRACSRSDLLEIAGQ